jgi:putative redox protein
VNASVVWKEGLVFDAHTETGFHLTTAAHPREGEPARGPLPMELVLVAAGSCTAIDVAAILAKMREPFTGLKVDVVADRREEHPRVFTAIRLHYTVRGTGLDPAQVQRAIQLSQERYCSVAAMLRPTVPLTYTWEVEEEGGERERAVA